MKLGQKMFWDGWPVTVTKIDVPGGYFGPRVEITFDRSKSVMLTSSLDHRLTEVQGEIKPSLSSLMRPRGTNV